MGLSVCCVEFDDEPPREEELVAHLKSQVGDVDGLESYVVEGRRASIHCMQDPITEPYALAFLTARGGRPIDVETGEPRPSVIPPFVEQPWHSYSWWSRTLIWFGMRRRG